MLQIDTTWIYLPSTVARRAIRMYMPFSAWRKYAALGSVSTSTLREKHKRIRLTTRVLLYPTLLYKNGQWLLKFISNGFRQDQSLLTKNLFRLNITLSFGNNISLGAFLSSDLSFFWINRLTKIVKTSLVFTDTNVFVRCIIKELNYVWSGIHWWVLWTS